MITTKDCVITLQLIRCAGGGISGGNSEDHSTLAMVSLCCCMQSWSVSSVCEMPQKDVVLNSHKPFLKCAIRSKKVFFQRSRICQQYASDALQHSLLRAAERNSCLLLFFMLGGRRKILNLAAEQGVNPFLSYLGKKKKLEEENSRDKMYKLHLVQVFISEQKEWIRQRHVPEERQKIKYEARSYGSVRENTAVICCFQCSRWGISTKRGLEFLFCSQGLLPGWPGGCLSSD